jgi:hypothetical protein
VNPEIRLAEIVAALEDAGLACLVMGGHAVRYYGLRRDTIDFDLHLSSDVWGLLPQKLGKIPLFAVQGVVEGPTWRPHAFRRFQIGQLPDGREEWLEFWSANHLLSPFAELYARRERGAYGGRVLSFLSLPDLIRSKETERASDWRDINVLEEFLDARLLSEARSGCRAAFEAIAGIRSRRGFETALQGALLSEVQAVESALMVAPLSITQAFLLPFAAATTGLLRTTPPLEPLILKKLRTVVPASPLHLALVEVVRRQYRAAAQAADRTDKDAALHGQRG